MTTYQFLFILFMHWVADFVCQTHWQATNKSKNNEALFAHIIVYTFIMSIGAAFVIGYEVPLGAFFLITFATHFCTDYITSRITSKLYAKQDFHNFFVVIGFDQLIHFTTLALTLVFLGTR